MVSAREPYGRFATYYDFIYHGLVNYQGDVNFLEAIFRRELRTPPRDILDLGCGTGNHDLALAKRGYQVTGLDRSSSQLSIARRKARAARVRVRFVRGDMRAFDLARTFDSAVCMFGAFGYLTQKSDAVRCLKAVHRHLRVGGLFVYEFWHTAGGLAARRLVLQGGTQVRARPTWTRKIRRSDASPVGGISLLRVFRAESS